MHNATHFTFPAEGHGEIFTNACAMSIMTDFVAHPQQKPQADCLPLQQLPAFGKAIALIPYIDEEHRFSTVMPNDWQESSYGGFDDFNRTQNITFAVSSDTKVADNLLNEYSVDISQGITDRWQLENNGMSWKLYLIQGGAANPMYVALTTKNHSTYAIMVSAPSQDIQYLVSNLFYPAIDAFQIN